MTRSNFYPRCRAFLEVVFDGRGAPNSQPFHIEIDPRSATVGVNGFYEADTFTMDFDTRQLPFDPDQVAYCAARIYMWDSARNLTYPEWAIDQNLMIKGLVDDIESKLVGEDNIVTFTGRDYTAILLDPEWDPKQKVEANGNDLREAVQAIADAAAPASSPARMEVVWEGEDDPPIIGGLARSTKKKGLWVKPGKTYWDVIWDLCIQHAYVPRVEGSTIFISEPVTQTKQTLLQAPRLVYGQTLLELDVKRKFAREKVPQIVIVAYDPKTKQKIEVVYPKKRNVDVMTTAEKQQSTDALGILLTVKKDEQMFFPAPAGVVDKDALERYARIRFYHIGRGETVYSMKTKHLAIPAPKSHGAVTDQLKSLGEAFGVYKRQEQEINLLQLRPGAAIGIEFDPFNREALKALPVGQRVQHIIALGYGQKIANFVAANLDRMELFKQDFYYNRGEISYSTEEGIEISIEAANFASEIREIAFAEPGATFTGGSTLPSGRLMGLIPR